VACCRTAFSSDGMNRPARPPHLTCVVPHPPTPPTPHHYRMTLGPLPCEDSIRNFSGVFSVWTQSGRLIPPALFGWVSARSPPPPPPPRHSAEKPLSDVSPATMGPLEFPSFEKHKDFRNYAPVPSELAAASKRGHGVFPLINFKKTSDFSRVKPTHHFTPPRPPPFF